MATYAGCPYSKPNLFLYEVVGLWNNVVPYEIFCGPLVSQVDTNPQSAATTWPSFFYHNNLLESFLRIRSVENNTRKIWNRLFFIKRGTKFSWKSFFFFLDNRRKRFLLIIKYNRLRDILVNLSSNLINKSIDKTIIKYKFKFSNSFN